MSSDPFADEQRAQGRFVVLLTLSVILALILIGAATIDAYRHPAPPIDCARPIDYPLCERASTPAPAQPPSDIALFLGTIGAVILAILLIWVGYHASVTEQKELVTAAAGSAPTAKQTPTTAQPTPSPTAPQPTPPASSMGPAKGGEKGSPAAIRNNTITPEMIAPPKDVPAKGITTADLKSLPGGK